jgi:drug/metabolite transporter (DMT)-like permease
MLTGLLAGLAAGAFWGLTFVAPTAVKPYTEIDLAIFRYLAFGGMSLLLMAASARFRPRGLSAADAWTALFLGLTGYVTYYVFVAYAVTLSGPAIAPLIIGSLPLLLAVYGNWQDRSLPWAKLAGPLALIAAGLAVINGATIAASPPGGARAQIAAGIALACCGLFVWFSYAVVNARVMRRPAPPEVLPWTGLQGVGAMAGVLPLIVAAPLLGLTELPVRGLSGPDGQRLLFWVLLTGVIGSWVAQLCWTYASKVLPLALAAQLIVAETVFALIYGFAFAGRWPHAPEWLGAGLLIAGVLWGVQTFARHGADNRGH